MYERWLRCFVSAAILALVVVGTASGFTAGRDPSLVAWWRLDEGAGSVVTDSSGSGYHGHLNGDCTWGAGKLGGAVHMGGTNGYIQAPHVPLDSRTWTLAMWINPVLTGPAVIFREEEAASANLSLHVRMGGASSGDQTPVRGIRLGFYGNDLETAPGLIQDHTWYHLTFWYDHEERIRRIYVDGVQVAQGTVANPFVGKLGDVALGVWHESQYYQGIMDDVRIYYKALTVDEIEEVMKGGADPALASAPSPKNKAADVPRDTTLAWMPGIYPGTHDVFLGTSFDDVNTAGRGSALLVSQGQTSTTYDPAGLLDFGQTYYWRVDEVNASPDSFIYKGDVWRYTVEPYAYPVTPVAAKSSTPYGAKMLAVNTINGSGLDPDTDEHLTGQQYMWQSAKGPQPAWIQYEFDQVYKLHQMWVWNHNSDMELENGYGAKEVAIDTSIDGTTWTALPKVPEFAQATGEPNYVHNTTVDFGGALAKYVKLTLLTNWSDGAVPYRGLSEVRFFQAPVRARGPEPASGAADVELSTVLNWRPGREAASHEVYFGTAPDALVLSKTVTDHRVALADLGAEYDQTYYWKVNEVNTAAQVQSWEGRIWSLSTAEYGVVDDFEAYDDACRRVFFTWLGGAADSGSLECGRAPYAGNGTGSAVGNDVPPYADMDVVHAGTQSMPFSYDNTAGYATSEATRTFGPAQDWTRGGAKTLVLFFRGDPANGPGQLYVKINNTRVDYNGSAEALTRPLWRQWNIDLASVPGLQSVQSLSIGVSGSVRGKLLIDDILLYRTAPEVPVPVDPGTTGLSAYYTFEGNVQDSSGKGNHGTAVNDPTYQESWAGLGQALRLDGVNDHVDLPIGNLVGTLASATFATWVDFDTMSAGAWQRVFDFGTGSTAYMFLTPRQGTSGAMRFAITSSGNAAGAESILDAPTRLPEGWHHVAVVIDGATKAMLLYLDGEVLNRGPTNTLPMDLGVTTQNWLGRSQYDTDGYFGGSLDEFRIYDRALEVGEVRYLAGDR